jgi:Ca2+-binding EF-hand superfamily protein
VTSTQYVLRLTNKWPHADTDHSGFLDKAEMNVLLQELMHVEVKTEIKHMRAQVACKQESYEKFKPCMDDTKIKKLLQPYLDTIAKLEAWKPNVAEMVDKMWNELDENHDGKVCQHSKFFS